MAPRVIHSRVLGTPNDPAKPTVIGGEDWDDDHAITGLGSAAEADTTDFAAVSHTHTASQVSDFNTAADARIAAAVGTSVQAYDADLSAWAGVNPTSYSTTVQIAAAYQPLDADLTSWAGVTRASGFDTFAATPSSANLKAVVTDETGSGALVFGTSPTLNSPVLGDYIDLTEIATPATPGATVARVWAEDSNGISVLRWKSSLGVNHDLGRDLLAIVRNTSGGTLAAGTVVYVSGATSSTANVAKAKADSITTMPALGVVVASIANNAYGQVATAGDVQNLDTSGFTVGDLLYVSAATAGVLTATPPSGANIPQPIGIVTRSHVSLGTIYVIVGAPLNPTLTQTFINKTVNLTSNTLSGTKAQFNTACSDTDFLFVNDTVAATAGGTGQTTVTSGDLLYGSASNVWSKLAKGSDGNVLTLASGLPTWAAPAAGGSAFGPPQGRLTLVTATPVLTSDQTAKTSIFYTPHVGDQVPIYSGSAWAMTVFTERTLSLDTTNHVSGSLYDVFIWSNAGTVSIGTGPAWSSSTARGTGAGTTELERKNGLWTNKNSITLKNGAGAGTSSIAANTATYVGTFYATANGQTGMAFKPTAASGGTNNFLALFNAYNRVTVSAICRDVGTDYTYTTGTWRASNNSNSNRISYVDGLQQTTVRTRFNQGMFNNAGGYYIGVVVDATSGAPERFGGIIGNAQIGVDNEFQPLLGFHYFQAMEFGGASGTALYRDASYGLHLTLEM